MRERGVYIYGPVASRRLGITQVFSPRKGFSNTGNAGSVIIPMNVGILHKFIDLDHLHKFFFRNKMIITAVDLIWATLSCGKRYAMFKVWQTPDHFFAK